MQAASREFVQQVGLALVPRVAYLFLWLSAIWLPLAPFDSWAQPGNRKALVIGNAAYTVGPLKNPVNDAIAMERKLTELGFQVQRIDNFKRQQVGRIVPAFTSTLKPGDEVIVFYAGHGVQVKGINYMPAVDADIQSEDDVPLNSLNLNTLMERLEEAKAGLKLIFLDACRNNPYARSMRSGDRGLARVGEASSGTMIHFATRPGSVAADGTGSNGLYTSKLLAHLATPNLALETMLKRVSAAVEAESKGAQQPWSEGSIRGEFYFRRVASMNTDSAMTPELIEHQAWSVVEASNTIDAIDAYLTEYPTGRYAPAGRIKRQALASRPGQSPLQAALAGGAKAAGTVFEDCAACPKMVAIPAGKFRSAPAATDRSKQKDFVVTKDFAVGTHEITFAQWDACVADGACTSVSDEGWGRGDQPVVNVSWLDAKAYVKWISQKTGQPYRLLRDAEWEYVARAGSVEPYPWGGDAGFDNANCVQCGAAGYSGKQPATVGTFGKNSFGLFDVIGNVWEWVEDCSGPELMAPSEPASAESTACASRVLRGGSYKTASREATVEQRRPANTTVRSSQNGFRIARDFQ